MTAISRRLALLAGAAAVLAACDKVGGKAGALEDMSLGDANAKVKVVEYASLSCPHCMRFNNEVFPAFKAKYIDTGKVHYTFREFITPPAEVAAAGALLARCAGKDKYFAVIDEIYHGLPAMAQANDYRGGLLRVAQSAGLTEAQFDKCVSDPDALKALNARVEGFVKKEKIESTPTFVVGAQKLVGEQTLESLSAAIDPMLK
jgi:protein-disulfide isomerase